MSFGLWLSLAVVLAACAQRPALELSNALSLQLCFSEALAVEGVDSTQRCFPVSVRYERP
jgi:hypothetical protein